MKMKKTHTPATATLNAFEYIATNSIEYTGRSRWTRKALLMASNKTKLDENVREKKQRFTQITAHYVSLK